MDEVLTKPSPAIWLLTEFTNPASDRDDVCEEMDCYVVALGASISGLGQYAELDVPV